MANKVFLSALLCSSIIFFPINSYAAEDNPDYKTNKLTGNWGGARDIMYDNGVAFDVYYKLGLWDNLSGGTNKDAKWLDNLDIKLSVDGKKSLGINGLSSQIYLLNNNGLHPNNNLGSIVGVDNIEVADKGFKLYSAWVQQNFMDDALSIKLGIYDLNSEFYVTGASGIFLNPAYGIGTEVALTGDNGPSIFPNPGLGARIAIQPTTNTYVQMAIIDGVPNDPNNKDSTQIEFEDNQGALLVGEIGLRDENYGHYGFGAWKYTAEEDDLVSGEKNKSQGIYLIGEKTIYKTDNKSIDAFARIGFTAGDVNQISHAWGTGVVLGGFIPNCENAQIGFAVSNANNSDKYEQANSPIESNETQLELTYSDKLLPWLSVQPDLQYTINPGTAQNVDNAFTVGVRFGIDF